MKNLLRRLRGIVGTGLIWAVGWAGATSALGILVGVPFRYAVQAAIPGLIQGFVAGGTFAIILSIAERRHTLGELLLRRVALWGGMGGVLLFLPTLVYLYPFGIPWGRVLFPLAIQGMIGAGFASGSVALARRGENELIEGEEEAPLLGGG